MGDHDAEREGDDEPSPSKRLALCNMDWDRVGAPDIYLAMNSFCPKGGSVRCVKIYLSEFGKERLAEEEKLGPQELRQNQGAEEEDSSSDEENQDQETIDKKARERVRRYQVNRLKYYY